MALEKCSVLPSHFTSFPSQHKLQLVVTVEPMYFLFVLDEKITLYLSEMKLLTCNAEGEIENEKR